jgi:hypothetical protein
MFAQLAAQAEDGQDSGDKYGLLWTGHGPMKNRIIVFVLVVLLTLPVYLGLANTPAINDRFLYGQGWADFQPLFDLCNNVGIYGNASILVTTMFVVSFLVALAGVSLFRLAIRRIRG